jgi:hypothetical protein
MLRIVDYIPGRTRKVQKNQYFWLKIKLLRRKIVFGCHFNFLKASPKSFEYNDENLVPAVTLILRLLANTSLLCYNKSDLLITKMIIQTQEVSILLYSIARLCYGQSSGTLQWRTRPTWFAIGALSVSKLPASPSSDSLLGWPFGLQTAPLAAVRKNWARGPPGCLPD